MHKLALTKPDGRALTLSLAAADDADVMAAWAGLGYYARARNMLACARAVAAAGGDSGRDGERGGGGG